MTAEIFFFQIFFSKFQKIIFSRQKNQKIKNNFFFANFVSQYPENAKNPIKNGPVRIKDKLFDFSDFCF
jgi:hypothetical protein